MLKQPQVLRPRKLQPDSAAQGEILQHQRKHGLLIFHLVGHFVFTVVGTAVIRGYGYQKQSALLQLFRNNFRPFVSDTDPVVKPDPIAQCRQLLDQRIYARAVLMTIAEKNKGFRTQIWFRSALHEISSSQRISNSADAPTESSADLAAADRFFSTSSFPFWSSERCTTRMA